MKRLINKTNVDGASGDYPYGRIRNNPGNGTGTPFSEELYGDIQQFFEQMFAASGITANGLPDNTTNGFQLWLAFLAVTPYQQMLGNVKYTLAVNVPFSVSGVPGKNRLEPAKTTLEFDLTTSPANEVITFGSTIPKGVPINMFFADGSGTFSIILNASSLGGYPPIRQEGITAADTPFSIPLDHMFQIMRMDDHWRIYNY